MILNNIINMNTKMSIQISEQSLDKSIFHNTHHVTLPILDHPIELHYNNHIANFFRNNFTSISSKWHIYKQ